MLIFHSALDLGLIYSVETCSKRTRERRRRGSDNEEEGIIVPQTFAIACNLLVGDW